MSRTVTLLLPLTASTYTNPSPLLPTIYRTLSTLPAGITHFDVLFITPNASVSQIYAQIRSNPTKNWDSLQAFLGKVYACLAAAQWTCGRVLLEVEVAFEGEVSSTRQQGKKEEYIILEGELLNCLGTYLS